MCDKKKLLKAGYSEQPLTIVPIIPERVMKKESHISRDFIRDLEILKNILAATVAIDFECDFTSDGTCKGQYGGSHLKAGMCCCAGCAGSGGYFRSGVLCTPKQFLYYKNRWDTLYGFWRPGKGCILPRENRSITCLFFNCLFKQAPTKNDKSEAIDKLRSAAFALDLKLRNLLKEVQNDTTARRLRRDLARRTTDREAGYLLRGH